MGLVNAKEVRPYTELDATERELCDDLVLNRRPDALQRLIEHFETPTPQTAAAAAMALQHGVGCSYCNMTGYRGRVAVYELLEIDRGQADAIRRGDLTQFASLAHAQGSYKPLTQAAIELAARGLTTLAEVISSMSGLGDEMAAAIPADGDESELEPERVLSLLA